MGSELSKGRGPTFLLTEPVFLRKVGVACYGTFIAVILHGTFDHLLQGFRIHMALHSLSQALGKRRGEEIARCTEAPALMSCWTQIQPLLSTSAQVDLSILRPMQEGSACQSWPSLQGFLFELHFPPFFLSKALAWSQAFVLRVLFWCSNFCLSLDWALF